MRPTVRDNGFVAVHIFDNRVMWFQDGPKKKITTKKDSAINVGFWCQAIHKKILQRFDTSFDKKITMKIYAIEIILKSHEPF